jgi:hypothetical protein
VLLAGNKRLPREVIDVGLISNQKGNDEKLKLIPIGLECTCISPGPPKRCK